MSPNKTLYIREADTEVWERAEKVASRRGTSVSQLATDALRSALPQVIAEDDPRMKEIRVRVYDRDRELELEKAFIGRWLVPYSEDSRTSEDGYMASACFGVALTKRGSIAVYATIGYEDEGTLSVYDNFDQAEADGQPADILAEAAQRVGQSRPVWLDI